MNGSKSDVYRTLFCLVTIEFCTGRLCVTYVDTVGRVNVEISKKTSTLIMGFVQWEKL